MKKILTVIFAACLIILGSDIFAQHTPQQIAEICQQFDELNKRDEADEVFDAAYAQINKYIAECDKLLKTNHSRELLAERAIWENRLAQLETSYLARSFYAIRERTFTQDQPKDIKTWSVNLFLINILQNNWAAINDACAANLPIDDYAPLCDNANSTLFFSTLFDLIAYDFEYQLDKIPFLAYSNISHENKFTPQWENYFEKDFFTTPLTPTDSLNIDFNRLCVYQALDKYHQDNGNSTAQMMSHLHLYKMLKERCKNAPLEALCEALQRDATAFENIPGCWVLYATLADEYLIRANISHESAYYNAATEWFEKTLDLLPSTETEQIERCQEALEKITAPNIQIYIGKDVYPEPTLYQVIARNCDRVWIYLSRQESDFRYLGVKTKLDIVFDTVLTISSSEIYHCDTLLALLPQQLPGKYLLFVSPEPITDSIIDDDHFKNCGYMIFPVSRLGYKIHTKDTQLYLWVLDRKTGKPIKNAKVTLNKVNPAINYKNPVLTARSNADGYVTFDINKLYTTYVEYNNYSLDIEKGNDALLDEECYFFHKINSERAYLRCSAHSDRTIYRPGQIIHWKAIFTLESPHEASLAPNSKIVVHLRNANYQIIALDTMITNEFGSIAGEFTLPKFSALGHYSINFFHENSYVGSVYFRVEEYKRPTFDITIEQPEDTYRTGEMVHVTGDVKAFAGYPVQNATVSYRIQCRTYFPFSCFGWQYNPYRFGKTEEIGKGECKTDGNGHFSIDFTALKEDEYNQWNAAYRYTITVKVTDLSGETHEDIATVIVSDKAWIFNFDLPNWIRTDIDGYTFPLSVVNFNQKAQNAKIDYRIVELDMPQRYLVSAPFTSPTAAEQFGSQLPQFDFHSDKNWAEKETVIVGDFDTENGKEISIPQLKKLKPGAYKIILTTTDPYGEKLEEEFSFYLSQNEKSAFPVYTPLHLTADKSTAYIGDTVTFTISSYINPAYALVHIFSNDKLLKSQWVTLHQSSYTIKHIVKDGQEGFIFCEVYLTYNKEHYKSEEKIAIPFENKKIDFEFITFRNKLEPGEKTTVKLRLNNEFQKPLTKAELLCTMYDASLDAFRSNNFSTSLGYISLDKPFSIYENFIYIFGENPPLFQWNKWLNINHFRPQWKYNSHYPQFFDGFMADNTRSAILDSEPVRKQPGRAVTKAIVTHSDEKLVEAAAIYEEDDTEIMFGSGSGAGAGASALDGAVVPIDEYDDISVTPRTNFDETAFFYPFLRTNEQGEIEMEFTIPESLTEWKMLGLAHTLDLRVGTFEKRIQTQKQLMVVSNAPRFVYEHDRLDFTAKVVSMSEKEMNGTATLQLFDAESNEEIFSQQMPLLLAPSATEPVTFSIDVPMGVTAITYRFTAQCRDGEASFTDGEENTLPVLSRRVIVSESVPLFITQKGTKNFSLNGLDNNNKSLISCQLQFTPDPKWDVIFALPYLTEYPYDCNEQLFSKLYANALSSYIIQQNPNLVKLLNDCRDNHPEALQSKLRQNEDLMQILLAETPWLKDAQNWEQDILDLFCLFDQERVADEMKSMVNKLEKNQNGDGGWPWFKGGLSSLYITNHLLIGTGRLMERGVCQAGDNFLKNTTLQEAVHYVDVCEENYYRKLKNDFPESLETYRLGSSTLHYLYARSFYMDIKNENESYRFYEKKLYEQAMELPTFYQKTLAALTLYRWNTAESKALAKQLMEEVKKYAKHSEELGMYWKKEGYGYYWDDAVIERQALMMEAFDLILNDKESVREMEIWLLQQRRTNHWGTTRATAEACYAVFCNGAETSKAAPGNITLTMGDVTRRYTDTLQIPVKEDVTEALSGTQAGTAVLSRDNDGLAYGGLIYKYWADIDSITSTGTDIPLSVERQLYRVDLGERGETLTLVTDENPLHVGDKVRVRMEIRADRDLEYIHLKDLRAAAFEPTETLSGYLWQDGLGYYQSFRDASVNFFFDNLNRGTYVFEYTLFVTQSGTFSSGYASIQCMYAPEFNAHSTNNGKISIEKKKQ